MRTRMSEPTHPERRRRARPAAHEGRLSSARRLPGSVAGIDALGGRALIMTDVSGSPAWSGMAATMLTPRRGSRFAAAGRAARRSGRALALATGAAACSRRRRAPSARSSAPSRCCSSARRCRGRHGGRPCPGSPPDLSEPRTRGRTAIVVWATTVGAIAGPNLIAPADAVADSGLERGVFLIAIAGQVVAGVFYLVGLRPDPPGQRSA